MPPGSHHGGVRPVLEYDNVLRKRFRGLRQGVADEHQGRRRGEAVIGRQQGVNTLLTRQRADEEQISLTGELIAIGVVAEVPDGVGNEVGNDPAMTRSVRQPVAGRDRVAHRDEHVDHASLGCGHRPVARGDRGALDPPVVADRSAREALGDTRPAARFPVAHQDPVCAAHVVVVHGGDELGLAAAFDRQKGAAHPIVRMNHLRTFPADHVGECAEKLRVGNRRRVSAVPEDPLGPLKSPAQAVHPHPGVLLVRLQSLAGQRGDRYVMPPRDQFNAQIPHVLLGTADHRRIGIDEHQDAHGYLRAALGSDTHACGGAVGIGIAGGSRPPILKRTTGARGECFPTSSRQYF